MRIKTVKPKYELLIGDLSIPLSEKELIELKRQVLDILPEPVIPPVTIPVPYTPEPYKPTPWWEGPTCDPFGTGTPMFPPNTTICLKITD